ncbi:type II toxin-antitoxin system RelE/ParE family toxin [Methylobacterium organophilum]|uniref:type II toxin-antitoxin system RelE/ParE family toxin n=1 Tax=Methylobacterium organophilum TaxID=410 RepID=UPI001F135CDC|nr:type II toxin-antitoxin system RelE/ParE family toxin [Methylobacterium organophilum]UMY16548.1 type II toxin-antitoxin system RelE/ParE family toxin [Methylobacterium organophilum]
MTIRLSRRAVGDIIEIYTRGAQEYGTQHAERYGAGLRALFRLLAANPGIARRRTEFSRPVRLHPYRAHLVAYTEQEDGILIVRVLHNRQDWPRHLS